MSLFQRPGSQGFTAKYSGICEECGGDFEAGENVMYRADHELVHADATDCVVLSETIQKPCVRCFLVHAGDCF